MKTKQVTKSSYLIVAIRIAGEKVILFESLKIFATPVQHPKFDHHDHHHDCKCSVKSNVILYMNSKSIESIDPFLRIKL